MLDKLITILTAWGPLGLFVIAFVDNAGVPMPQGIDVLLIFLASQNAARAYYYAALAVLASISGSLVLFLLARKGGEVFLDRRAPPEKTRWFRAWFQRYGLLTIFIPALIPLPLPLKVFVISAGALKFPTTRFLAALTAGRLPRYFGVAYLGARMGADSWTWLLEHAAEMALFALALFLFCYSLIQYFNRRAPQRQ
ncbi:MAG: VTT domain-containing protein [Bryobacteraceae bacterium]